MRPLASSRASWRRSVPNSKAAPAALGACALCTALTAAYEGLRTKPYHDPGDGRLTVCYGETEREMRTYTPQECAALLRERQMSDYAPKVLQCVPAFADER